MRKGLLGVIWGLDSRRTNDKHNLPATPVSLATRTTCIGYSIESSLFLKLQLIKVALNWKPSLSALSSCTRPCSQLGYNILPPFWSITPENR